MEEKLEGQPAGKTAEQPGLITIEEIGPGGIRPIGLNAPYIPTPVTKHKGDVFGGFIAFGSVVAMITPIFMYSMSQIGKLRKTLDSEKSPVPIEQKIEQPLAFTNPKETAKIDVQPNDEATTKWRELYAKQAAQRELAAKNPEGPIP